MTSKDYTIFKELNAEFIHVLKKLTSDPSFIENSFKALEVFRECNKNGGTIYFIGNGGSAAISSHMAQDYTKMGLLKAQSFNDSSLITCLANDYSYAQIFEKAISMYTKEHDVVVAISSSGKSGNILNGVTAAKNRKLNIVTLSGFNQTNPLNGMGYINFYVPNSTYRVVEIIHEYILHTILDYHTLTRKATQ